MATQKSKAKRAAAEGAAMVEAVSIASCAGFAASGPQRARSL